MEQARVQAILDRYKGVLEARGNTIVPESEAKPDRDPRERKLDHCLSMISRINDKFSEGKTNRWLGWIQGVLFCEGIYTIDEERQHNLKSREVVGRSVEG